MAGGRYCTPAARGVPAGAASRHDTYRNLRICLASLWSSSIPSPPHRPASGSAASVLPLEAQQSVTCGFGRIEAAAATALRMAQAIATRGPPLFRLTRARAVNRGAVPVSGVRVQRRSPVIVRGLMPTASSAGGAGHNDHMMRPAEADQPAAAEMTGGRIASIPAWA